MTAMLEIQNHGPLIIATNYWGSEIETHGKIHCSCNAGCIRVLLPRTLGKIVGECRTSRYVVCSRGPWVDQGLLDAVELLFEDNSESPYCLHLSPESFDLLPGEPEPGGEWTVALWVLRDGGPHKALERPCYWRRVERIPCLQPWAGRTAQ